MVHHSENEVSKINFIYIDLFWGGLLELAAFEIKRSLHLQSLQLAEQSLLFLQN